MASKYENLLLQALVSDHGLLVKTNNVDALRQQLYNIRKKDSVYSDLSFVVPAENPQTHLCIIKTSGDSDAKEE